MATRALRSVLRSRTFAITIGLGLTALLVWRIGPGRVGASVERASLLLLVAAVALNVPVILLRTWRSHVLLRRLDAKVSAWRLTTSGVVGLTLSGITPAAGGDLVRAYLWRRDDGVPVHSGALVVIVERVGALALMGLLGLSTLALELAGWQLRVVALLSWVCLGFPWLASRLGVGSWLLRQTTRLPLVRRWATRFERSADEVVLMSEDVLLQVGFCALSGLIFAISGAQVWLLVIGLGGSVPYLAAIAGYCLSQVGGAISNLPFGLAAGDALLVLVLAQVGLTPHVGAAAAILLRATTTLPIALAAAAAWVLTLPGRRTLGPAGDR
ncbi:MAG: flippase-like domain-containing protein [Candidatus Dormibacteraeota bacterium]|nr:flippase-like domain-containing protein [Candidatus Dormibacteraeota bacterium]